MTTIHTKWKCSEMLKLTKDDLGLDVSGVCSITYEFLYRTYRYIEEAHLRPFIGGISAEYKI